MDIIGRRKDGVLLVSLTGGLVYAVNLKHRRVAPIAQVDAVLADYHTWPHLLSHERPQYVPAVRNLLAGQYRQVSLAEVGWGMEDDYATAVQPPSMDERRQSLQAALDAVIKRRFGSFGNSSPGYPSMAMWIKEIRDQSDPPYIVYCDAEGKHFKWEYSGDVSPQFLGDPVPVEYVPVEV